MRKKYICILVAVIGVCSLSGCGSSAKKTEEEQVTIGVVTKSKSSEYWLSVGRIGLVTAHGGGGRKISCRCGDSVPGFRNRRRGSEKYDPGSSENRYPGDGSFSYRFL